MPGAAPLPTSSLPPCAPSSSLWARADPIRQHPDPTPEPTQRPSSGVRPAKQPSAAIGRIPRSVAFFGRGFVEGIGRAHRYSCYGCSRGSEHKGTIPPGKWKGGFQWAPMCALLLLSRQPDIHCCQVLRRLAGALLDCKGIKCVRHDLHCIVNGAKGCEIHSVPRKGDGRAIPLNAR